MAQHSLHTLRATDATCSCGSGHATRALSWCCRLRASLTRTRRRLLRWLGLLALACLVNASVQVQGATFTWGASPDATSYRLYRATGMGPFSVILSTTNLWAQVTASEPVRLYVTAWNAAFAVPESQPSNIVDYAPVPTQPSGIWINDVQRRRRDLGWSSDLSASTVIERAIESGPFETVAVVPEGVQHWSDTKARQKVTHYRLRSPKCSPWG